PLLPGRQPRRKSPLPAHTVEMPAALAGRAVGHPRRKFPRTKTGTRARAPCAMFRLMVAQVGQGGHGPCRPARYLAAFLPRSRPMVGPLALLKSNKESIFFLPGSPTRQSVNLDHANAYTTFEHALRNGR